MNLSNGIHYDNPFFDAAFGEYLLANGFTCTAVKNTLYFISKEKQLVVRNDNIDLFSLKQGELVTDAEKWVFNSNHTGLQGIDLFKWMLLMHCMNILSLNQFLRNARAKDHQAFTEAQLLVKSILLTGANAMA